MPLWNDAATMCAISLPPGVVAELQRPFSDVDQAAVIDLLPAEADLPLTPPYERVLLAIVGLSAGNISHLAHYSQAARADWRDVLYWHENPRDEDEVISHRELRPRFGLPPDPEYLGN